MRSLPPIVLILATILLGAVVWLFAFIGVVELARHHLHWIH